MSEVVRSEQKNTLMIESMLEVSGLFHSSQVGLGWSIGKWKRTFTDRRWDDFVWCTGWSRVCWSVILSSSEVIYYLTSLMQQAKKSEAKVADPTSWPRSLKPVESSTGILGAVLSVGWGVVENDAMEVESKRTEGGLWVVRPGWRSHCMMSIIWFCEGLQGIQWRRRGSGPVHIESGDREGKHRMRYHQQSWAGEKCPPGSMVQAWVAHFVTPLKHR